ncbi:MAG TPA: LysM domain-containing protein, partial [Rhizomicrobium sp.]|nr:LysM domain-containing protein [Rhizomicrobium sp.]
MEQQRATFENARRIAAAWLVLVPVFLAGCAETPAHVVDTDRTDTAYSPESDDDADAARVIVHEGDTLTRIAARCDTSIAMLVRLNDFGDNWSIYPGEILRIPPRHCDQRTAIPRPEPRPDYFPRDVASDAPPVQRRIDRADPHQDADATSTENSWWSWWTGKSSETQDTASRFIWP